MCASYNKVVLIINDLKKDKQLLKTISKQINFFKSFYKKSSFIWFQELCFCILTANYTAKKAIDIQEKIKDGFNNYSLQKLKKELRKQGHRFPNKRAEYIVYSRKFQKDLKQTLLSLENSQEKREWLVKNIKGLGYKEASHFLRNIGFLDVSIIDFHIVDFLVNCNIIKKPKTISKNQYLIIEEVLKKISNKTKLSLGELDLFLWYYETKTILK
jgi:N-glycosylase/DNA lyase